MQARRRDSQENRGEPQISVPPDRGSTPEAGDPRPSRWSSIRPGESLFWFPILTASAWALMIGCFAAVSVVFETEEGASWGEAAQAAAGNFAFVWVVAFVVSMAIRFGRRR